MLAVKPVSLIKFEKFDTDCDGNITKDQYRSLCYSLGHCFRNSEELEAAWTVLDVNGNGLVSYDEFLAWWKQDDRWGHLRISEDQLMLVTQAQGFFSSFDTDESGSLSIDEFRGCYENMAAFGFAMTDCDSALQELDTDGNGSINFNEFIRWMINVGALTVGS